MEKLRSVVTAFAIAAGSLGCASSAPEVKRPDPPQEEAAPSPTPETQCRKTLQRLEERIRTDALVVVNATLCLEQIDFCHENNLAQPGFTDEHGKEIGPEQALMAITEAHRDFTPGLVAFEAAVAQFAREGGEAEAPPAEPQSAPLNLAQCIKKLEQALVQAGQVEGAKVIVEKLNTKLIYHAAQVEAERQKRAEAQRIAEEEQKEQVKERLRKLRALQIEAEKRKK